MPVANRPPTLRELCLIEVCQTVLNNLFSIRVWLCLPYHYYYYPNSSYYADPEQVHVNRDVSVKVSGGFTEKAKTVLGKFKRE